MQVAPAGGIGEILRRYRQHNRLTQAELAQILHFDQSYVSRLERGTRKLNDVTELRSIAKRLGIPADQLGVSSKKRSEDNELDLNDVLSSIRAARIRRTLGEPGVAYKQLERVSVPLENATQKKGSDEEFDLVLAELHLARAWVLCELLPEKQLHLPVHHMMQAWQLVSSDKLDTPSAYILGTLGNHLRMNGQIETSLPVLQRALTYRDEPEEVVATANLLARASGENGQGEIFKESVLLAKKYLELCTESAVLVNDFSLTEIEARGLLRLGYTKQAMRVIDNRDGSSELLAIPQWRIIFAITKAEVLSKSGAHDDAAALLNDAARAAAKVGLPHQLHRAVEVGRKIQLVFDGFDNEAPYVAHLIDEQRRES